MALSSFLLARGDTKRRKRKGGILRSPRFGKRAATNPPTPLLKQGAQRKRQGKKKRVEKFCRRGCDCRRVLSSSFKYSGHVASRKEQKRRQKGNRKEEEARAKNGNSFSRGAHRQRGSFSLVQLGY